MILSLTANILILKKFNHMSSNQRKIYSAMVVSLDESVGNLTRALNETGMLNNSVIVFTTDNGGAPNGFNWWVNLVPRARVPSGFGAGQSRFYNKLTNKKGFVAFWNFRNFNGACVFTVHIANINYKIQ